jgi:hypothetical protein
LIKPYTAFPLDESDPTVKEFSSSQLWPAIKVQIGNLETRQRTPKFDAIVDSGSPWCIFKMEMAEFIGIRDVTSGPSYPLGGVIEGPRETMYFHKVNLFIEKFWSIEITAGFCKQLGTTGLLGRFGFFSNFVITCDHTNQKSPQLRIDKINRA